MAKENSRQSLSCIEKIILCPPDAAADGVRADLSVKPDAYALAALPMTWSATAPDRSMSCKVRDSIITR